MQETWTRFGWQGLSVEVPADWELVGIPKTHDPAEGYLRLDDRLQPRLELKWKSHPQRKFDIEKTLDDYLGGVRKQYGRGSSLDVKRDPSFFPRTAATETFFQDREALFFSWRSEWRAFGVIARCGRCGRVVMAQVIGPDGEAGLRSAAVRVLGSLSDHSDGEANLWTAYGLEMEIPRRYRLEKVSLLNGYLLFAFTDGSRRLAVERYGLADQLTRNLPMQDWFRRTYKKALNGVYFALESGGDASDSLRLEGRDVRWIDRIDRWDVGASRGWDRMFRRQRTSALVWKDSAANRLYVIRATAKEEPGKTAARVARSIPNFALEAD